jgi:ABC-type multidrug transport system ATPase subunit
MNTFYQKNISSLSPPSGLPDKLAGSWAGGSWKVLLTDTGKRFNRDWIFRHLDYTFETGRSYAITGPNGSGKSRLLQAIAGSMNLSEGAMEYRISNIKQGTEGGTEEQGTRNNEQGTSIRHPASSIPPENIYQYISICAPYLELIEEMSAKEFLDFHHQFKPLMSSVSMEEILSIIGLEKAKDKQIRYFSSGMKQRLKLAQAVFSEVPVLLLDEPCTNLDASGYQLYHDLISTYCGWKLIIVSSNDAQEMDFCQEKLNIMHYK